ncbi:hypothetical protein KEM54_000748 [Ascosphaera aggregata]|nr:hypothetical protein KEM54_000748 [Ascosphaera aggregata]
MSEIAFCKAFLSAVEARPVKIPEDHVFDPFEFQISFPYVLPRLDEQLYKPLLKKHNVAPPPGATKSVNIHLKSTRNPKLEFSLDNVDITNVSISDLKGEVQSRIEKDGAQVPMDKIKVLWKRKPVSGKTVSDAVGDEATSLVQNGGSIEFGIMVLCGATVVDKAAPGPSRKKITSSHVVVAADAGDVRKEQKPDDIEMKGIGQPSEPSLPQELDESFWTELDSFLRTRLNPKQATDVAQVFRTAWLAKP